MPICFDWLGSRTLSISTESKSGPPASSQKNSPGSNRGLVFQPVDYLPAAAIVFGCASGSCTRATGFACLRAALRVFFFAACLA